MNANEPNATEPKIEKKAAPQTKENSAKKSTLELPNITKYVQRHYLLSKAALAEKINSRTPSPHV